VSPPRAPHVKVPSFSWQNTTSSPATSVSTRLPHRSHDDDVHLSTPCLQSRAPPAHSPSTTIQWVWRVGLLFPSRLERHTTHQTAHARPREGSERSTETGNLRDKANPRNKRLPSFRDLPALPCAPSYILTDLMCLHGYLGRSADALGLSAAGVCALSN